MDQRIRKVADVLVNYSVAIQPGEHVMVGTTSLAEPLALAVYEEIVKAGGHVSWVMAPTGSSEIMYKHASDEQLNWVDPTLIWLYENVDVTISLGASANTKALSNVDPQKMAHRQKARRVLNDTFMRRQSTGELRWTLTEFPTHAAAQDANMSLFDYQDFVYGACMVHLDDPVAYWKQYSEDQQRLVDWLAGKKLVEVVGDNINLTLSIEGRTFINADGKKNFPDGEIYTGPVEDSVNGWVNFTYPAVYGGREVTGVSLRFEEGRVVEATADKGEDYLLSVLDTDEGARTLGEFAIGTNTGVDQFTSNILFDEKMGGTVHMAVGAGYPDTGSKNESAVHWDMICDMRSGGRIIVDGDLFYENGEFKI